MFTSPNMGLKIWNLVTDLFSHTQLEGNFSEIDAHDHTSGNGVQIPSGGIANGAITAAKIGFPAVSYSSGTLAALPAVSSATAGEYYYATDTGALMFCVDGAWVWVNGNAEAVGTVKHFAATTVPADADGVQRWHLCDGTAISRTTYATLYAHLGTTWGTGDGSTTFNLPNLLGRTVVGAGAGAGLTARTVGPGSAQTANGGVVGGQEVHALSAVESGVNPNGSTGTGASTGDDTPPHAHGFSNYQIPVADNGITLLGFEWTWPSSSPNIVSPGFSTDEGTTSNWHQITNSGAPLAPHTHTIPALGLATRAADSAHNTMPPFAVTQHIIKVL